MRRYSPDFREAQHRLAGSIARLKCLSATALPSLQEGRDDLAGDILDSAQAVLRRVDTSNEPDMALKAVRCLAADVVESFEAMRKYLREVSRCLERVDPHLCNNSGLVARLVDWEESWEIGAKYVRDEQLLDAVCDTVVQVKASQELSPSLEEMFVDCDAELFLVLPRLVWIYYIAGPSQPCAGLVRHLLPHRFEAASTPPRAEEKLQNFVNHFGRVVQQLGNSRLAYGLAPVVRDWAATGLYAANLWTSLRRDCHCTCTFTGLPDLLKTVRQGDKLYCLYSLEDRLFHERLLCGHVDGSRWVVATPDADVYVGNFADEDHVEIHRAGPRGGAPPQLRKKMLYRFDLDEQALAALLSEGAQLAESERREAGRDSVAVAPGVVRRLRGKQHALPEMAAGGTDTPRGSEVDLAAGASEPPLPPPSHAPPPRAGAGGGPLPPVQLDDGWVALESRLGFRRGSPVDVAFASVYALDDRALASFPEGVIALGRVGALPEEAPLSPRDARDEVLDERILRYRRSGTGQRRRAFAEVVAEQREVLSTQEWRVQGPATIGWLLQAHLEQGNGPVQRHYWWRQILGLAAADPGVDEHLFLCELIETASTADQLNLPGVRAGSQVEVSGTAGATADSDGWLGERRIFLGGSRSKGHALVAPSLEKHVAEKMQEESAILKERRKGREGRAATAVAMAASAQGVSDTGIARDVLPLPLGVTLDEPLQGAAARLLPHGGGRRGRQRRHQEVWLREGIATLNDLGGRGVDAPAGAPAACQVAAVRRLAQLYGRVEPPPSDLTPLGAWQTLQDSRNGYTDVVAEGASTTYRKGAMELPRAAAGRARLADVLPPHLQSLLCDSSQMLREPEARNFALGEAPRVCAMDPVLQRHGYQYGECLSELLSAGIIEPAAEDSIIERAGIFFVPKKDSSLRLIFDTRRSNVHFQDPPYTLLASGEALANLEVDAAGGIAVASGDVECCFYQYELPSWARAFFGLPAVQASFLDSAARQRLGGSDPSEMTHFVARVVPMGWSWAVHLTQEAHAHVLSTISPDAPWIADKVPTPALGTQCSTAKMLYIDNVAVFTSGSGDPALEVERMLAALGARGIQASFDRDDGDMHTLLGFVLHKPSATWRLSHSKFWRLKFSLDFALAPGRLVTGRELERLMGHITAAVMLQRHMLSLFHAIYEFCRRSRDKRQPLWSSVKRELTWFRALLPCATVSLSRPWCERVTATDAPPWGFGVVEQPWPISDVRRVGSLSERSRFRGVLTADYAPRDTLVEQQLLHATAAEVTAEGTLTHFEEVPAARLLADPWAVAAARRWRRAAAIHVLEAEGARWAVRRLARNSQLHGHRHLILGDNLGVLCACDKGRAAHFALNVICREICAISVASGMQLRFRWISSELNPGDAPSRRFMPGARKHHVVGQCSTPPGLEEFGTHHAGPLSGDIGSREHYNANDGLLGQPRLRQARPRCSGAQAGADHPARLRLARRARAARPFGLPPGLDIPGAAERQARRGLFAAGAAVSAALATGGASGATRQLALTTRSGSPRLLALPGWIPAQSDETPVDYSEWAFDRDMGQEASPRTRCALAGGEPALGRPVRRLFPSANASLSGGTQRPSGHSRQPLPRAPARAMAAVLASRGKPDSGRCVLVTVEYDLSPSETTTLLAMQFPPGRCRVVGGLQQPLLLLHPEGLTTSFRTGEFDSTVGPDLHRRHWIGRAVAQLQLLRRGDELLSASSHPQRLADFHVACQYLKLEGLDCSPHFLRHGDATYVCVAGYRALLEVRRRETWRTTSSVRRYDKAGRRAVVRQALSSAQRRSCESWAAAAPQLFDIAYVLPSAPAALASGGRSWISSQEHLRGLPGLEGADYHDVVTSNKLADRVALLLGVDVVGGVGGVFPIVVDVDVPRGALGQGADLLPPGGAGPPAEQPGAQGPTCLASGGVCRVPAEDGPIGCLAGEEVQEYPEPCASGCGYWRGPCGQLCCVPSASGLLAAHAGGASGTGFPQEQQGQGHTALEAACLLGTCALGLALCHYTRRRQVRDQPLMAE
ncbi:unnamed protein product [Prorocentrum cordatum]|nr:unnamed protein product [Polarella glacialis]